MPVISSTTSLMDVSSFPLLSNKSPSSVTRQIITRENVLQNSCVSFAYIHDLMFSNSCKISCQISGDYTTRKPQGSLCPEGLRPGGSPSRGVSVQGPLSGGSPSRGFSVQGVSVLEIAPYRYVRVVLHVRTSFSPVVKFLLSLRFLRKTSV